MAPLTKPPTFDFPGMGRMTAAEFARAYNEGRVPADLVAPGEGLMIERDDGRTVGWAETWGMRGADGALVFVDPLDYIGAQPC